MLLKLKSKNHLLLFFPLKNQIISTLTNSKLLDLTLLDAEISKNMNFLHMPNLGPHFLEAELLVKLCTSGPILRLYELCIST